MCKLLMSINPEYVESILAGTKQFEFRKTKCREKIESIVIYSTSPIMKVVAEVKVKKIIEGPPQEVWEETSHAAGIEKGFFDDYYNGRDIAVAYALGKVKAFKTPRKLSYYGIKNAPQSYVYLR